jgi:hypothetical protein
MPSPTEIATQRSRWLGMKHVGEARPVVRAFVRKGHLKRSYRNLPNNQVFGFIPGLLGPSAVWYGEWIPDSDYVEIPNIKDAKGDQDYSQNGIEQVTMTMDNIGMIEQTGNLGALFHMIDRGHYSPQRGQPSARGEVAGAKNEWFDTWKDKSTQIVILGGYGEAIFPLHVGLIDKVSLTSRPDQIVANLRSMGQFLSDQHVFMDAKNLWVRDPITFADRVSVQEGPNVANTAQAKSHKPGAPASLAVDGENKSAWVSQGHDDPRELEWIEFPVPAGRFIKFEMNPGYDNMEMYVSIFTTNKNVPGGGQARFGNGFEIGEGWLNEEKGHVPGTTIPFVNYVPGVRQALTTFPITDAGQKIISGDNTRIRLWFRNLHQAPTDNGKGLTNRAAVRECMIRDASVPEVAKKANWILVDDVSDIVKIVLQWVGIHDWEIETTGVRLSDKVVFDRNKYLIDIINYVKEQVGFIFYIKPPPEFDLNDLSPGSEINRHTGVAVFRQSSAMKQNPLDPIESVRDDNLLTGVNAAFDANVLPDSVRVRGKAVSDKIAQNDPEHIHALGADRTKRYQASYRPVWARKSSAGAAHLRRPVVHYDPLLDSTYLCQVACVMIAFRAALESAKGEIEMPCWPQIHLDHQTLLFDRGTGMSTRIWNVQRTWNFVSGAEVEFKMNLGGAFLDINDVVESRVELEQLLAEGGRMPASIARGPWTDPHKF